MKQILRVGSRDSKLAVAQTMIVVNELQRLLPEMEIQLVTMKTTGDRVLDRELEQVGGKGLFVRELDDALLHGDVDLTVHSLKDLPAELPEELPLAAFSKRADPRDALLFAPGCSEEDLFEPNAVIGSSGKRRIFQLQSRYPKAAFRMMRGNVQTRLKKLETEGYTATVLAMAGLTRLGLETLPGRIFSPEEVLPAAGQGILAVQKRRDDAFPWLISLDDRDAHAAALAERAFVRAVDGGCSSPMAAYAQIHGEELHLRGLYVDEATGQSAAGSLVGTVSDALQIGETLALRLKRQAKEET